MTQLAKKKAYIRPEVYKYDPSDHTDNGNKCGHNLCAVLGTLCHYLKLTSNSERLISHFKDNLLDVKSVRFVISAHC